MTMEYSPLIAPLVALVAWTIIVMLWMMVARFGEFRKAGINLRNAPPGGRGVDLEGKIDARAQWKSHNYNHLMEQPTIFYAIVLALALMGMDQPINVALVWVLSACASLTASSRRRSTRLRSASPCSRWPACACSA